MRFCAGVKLAIRTMAIKTTASTGTALARPWLGNVPYLGGDCKCAGLAGEAGSL